MKLTLLLEKGERAFSAGAQERTSVFSLLGQVSSVGLLRWSSLPFSSAAGKELLVSVALNKRNRSVESITHRVRIKDLVSSMKFPLPLGAPFEFLPKKTVLRWVVPNT